MITAYAEGRGLDVYAYTRADIRASFADTGATTRYEIAQVIAGRIHAFSDLPACTQTMDERSSTHVPLRRYRARADVLLPRRALPVRSLVAAPPQAMEAPE